MTIIKDPLLTAARIIIIVLMVVLGIAAVALLIGAGYLAFDPSPLLGELAEERVVNPSGGDVAAIIGIMVLALVPIGLLLVFLRTLNLVIDSVGAGDPFAPVNAMRLARMGWLMIGVQLSAIPIGALAAWLNQRLDVGEIGFEVSGEGVVLALVLFILARVFRHGAAMRDELEGTV